MSVRAQAKDKPAPVSFKWDDPFLLDDQLTEEERLIYQIGDMIGINRRTLVGTQRFVAVCLDRDGQLAGNC